MLDARWVADHLDDVRKALSKRSAELPQGLEAISELSSKRRGLIVEVEQKQAERREEAALNRAQRAVRQA